MCKVIFLFICGIIFLIFFSFFEKGGKKDLVEWKYLIMLSFFKLEFKLIMIFDWFNFFLFDLMKEDVELVLDNDLMFCMWLCKFIWYSVIYNLRKYKLGLYVIYVNEIEYDYFLFFFIFIGIDSELLDEYFDVFLEFDVFGDDDMEVE